MPSKNKKHAAAAASTVPAAAATAPATEQALAAAATPKPALKPKLRRNGPLHVREAARPGIVHVLTAANVASLPKSFAPDGKLYLCPSFAATASCAAGDDCANVHAKIDPANPPSTYTAHERDAAWKTVSDVPDVPAYAFFEATRGDIAVAPPNAKTDDDAAPVPACLCLRTRVFDADRTPYSHCAHFRAKGVCDLGAACMFVHALDDLVDDRRHQASAPQMASFAEEECSDGAATANGSSAASSPVGALCAGRASDTERSPAETSPAASCTNVPVTSLSRHMSCFADAAPFVPAGAMMAPSQYDTYQPAAMLPPHRHNNLPFAQPQRRPQFHHVPRPQQLYGSFADSAHDGCVYVDAPTAMLSSASPSFAAPSTAASSVTSPPALARVASASSTPPKKTRFRHDPYSAAAAAASDHSSGFTAAWISEPPRQAW